MRMLLTMLLIGIVANLSQFSFAQEEKKSVAAEGVLTTAQEFDKKGLTPQYPITLIGFDGSTYIYQSECCTNPSHVGLIFSTIAINTLGCPSPSPVPIGEGNLELELPPLFGSVATSKYFNLAYLSDFSTEPQSQVFKSREQGAYNPFSDYYTSSDSFDTAVGLKDSRGISRYFTLVRFRLKGTPKYGSAFDKTFPVLLLSRNTPEYDVWDKDASGNPIKKTVSPSRAFWDLDSVYPSWETPGYSLVKIDIPHYTTGVTVPVKCWLINRKP